MRSGDRHICRTCPIKHLTLTDGDDTTGPLGHLRHRAEVRALHSDDFGFLLDGTLTSLTSFDRTGRFKGFVDEGEFWENELGQRYLLRQLAAIERKVRIRRLFVLVDRDADSEQLTKLLRRHQEIGVETRVLSRDRIPALRRSDLADFIIFDQRMSYEFETAKVAGDNATPFTDVALIGGTKHRERRREVFEELWAAGQEVKSVTDPESIITAA